MGPVMGEQGFTYDVEIPHRIQNFMFHKFIVIAQAVAIEHLVIVHHDGVV